MATSNNVITLRRHDLDNLRVFLSDLVIVHHTALVYGGAGAWPFKSSCAPTDSLSLPLSVFTGFNQSFFMGLFFGISGRVSSQSLSKADKSRNSSRWEFVKSKSLRLGLPAVFYSIVVQPLVQMVASPRWDPASLKACASKNLANLRGIRGPVWYMGFLFLFDVAAALLKPKRSQDEEERTSTASRAPDYRTVGKWGCMVVAGACFLFRLRYPVGATFKPLGLQPAYAPQYVLAYTLGHLSYDQDEAELGRQQRSSNSKTPTSMTLETKSKPRIKEPSLPWTIGLSLLSLPLLLLPSILSGRNGGFTAAVNDMFGGWNVSALLYAIWNEASFVTIGPALIAYFSRNHNSPTKSSIHKPRYSYAAFLAHALVITLVGKGTDRLLLPASGSRPPWMESTAWNIFGPVALTAVAGTINIAASFAAGRFLVDCVPGLNRIL